MTSAKSARPRRLPDQKERGLALQRALVKRLRPSIMLRTKQWRTSLQFGRNVASIYNDFMLGLIGEIILYSSALSEGDRQKVEGYLAHKWGLADNLDGSHPYESSPP